MEQKPRGRQRAEEIQTEIKGAVARDFGAWVKQTREVLGWTQQDLRDRLEVDGLEMHITTIAKIERGTRPTSLDEASVIASLFGHELNWHPADMFGANRFVGTGIGFNADFVAMRDEAQAKYEMWDSAVKETEERLEPARAGYIEADRLLRRLDLEHQGFINKRSAAARQLADIEKAIEWQASQDDLTAATDGKPATATPPAASTRSSSPARSTRSGGSESTPARSTAGPGSTRRTRSGSSKRSPKSGG